MCIDRSVPRVIMPRNAAGCDAPRVCASTTTGESCAQPRHRQRSGHRLFPFSPQQQPSTADHHGQRTQQLLQPEEEERLRATSPRDRARGRRRPPPVPRKSVLCPLTAKPAPQLTCSFPQTDPPLTSSPALLSQHSPLCRSPRMLISNARRP